MFWGFHDTEKLTRKCYDIRWYGNRIRQFFTISAPKMDFDFVEPKIAFLNTAIEISLKNSIGSGLGAAYAYFIEESVEYMLLQMIASSQGGNVINEMYGYEGAFCSSVVPLFVNKNEYDKFMDHLIENRKQFKLEYNEKNVDCDMFSGAEVKNDPRIEQSFKLGKLLVEWLNVWRNSFCQ